MDRYKNIYRIPSTRLRTWDYSREAAYFVTICTQNREHFFGEIIDDEMCLSTLGTIAKQEWLQTPSIRPDMNIALDEFVLMPNHFHGIVIIGQNEINDTLRGRGDAMLGVFMTTPTDVTLSRNSFGPQRKNLSSIIRGFKSSVTTYARKNNLPFAWQERFHDHIIQSDEELDLIRNYITQNVMNWKDDKFY